MPDTQPRTFQCRHIFTDGHRCGSPCLRGQQFCYYHHTSRGRAAIPTVDLSQGEHQNSPLTLPSLEDRSAIQHSIGEVLNRLAANQLDPRRAGLLLYGLQIASLNLPQPAPGKPGQQPTPVEDIITDPDLGPIAPAAELNAGPADKRVSLTELLIQELTRNGPNLPPNPPSTPIPPPEPTLLDNLHAATEPTRLNDLTAAAEEESTTNYASTTASTNTAGSTTEASTPARRKSRCRRKRHCTLYAVAPSASCVISTEGGPEVSRSGDPQFARTTHPLSRQPTQPQ